MMNWDNPFVFIVLIVLPFLALLQHYFGKKRKQAALTFSDTQDFAGLPGNWRARGMWVYMTGYLLSLVFLIVSLAGPHRINEEIQRNVAGIDVVVAFDISSSMLAEDLRPNRLTAAKNLTAEFLDNRGDDRVGLVIFAGDSFTLVPPTTDYRLVRQQLLGLDIGVVRDGTAIGMGVATAVNRLKSSSSASKVIILLTDGENNAGEIDPLTSADLAAAYDIRLYTIGVSTEGTAPYPISDPVFGTRYHPLPVDIDEPMLTEMASRTGGRYFRARDNEALQQIYAEIDELETSIVDEIIYVDRKEEYRDFLLPSFLLLMLSMAAQRFFLRTELA
ncbi:MAG: Ca-activated chloride channel-like protein [Bacteroidetes bacterium HLUCCA01]|nr:MAG: Ca-activated chloride channel-like protein [Bacteroidetes bacterium HLUCCA01]